MPNSNIAQKLEKLLDVTFESRVRRQVISAIIIAAFAAILSAGTVYFLSQSIFWAILSCGVAGLCLLYITFVKLVTSSEEIEQFKALMLHVLRSPGAIVKATSQRVTICDKKGVSVTLSKQELNLWRAVVSPFLITHRGAAMGSKSARQGPSSAAVKDLQAELDALVSFKERLESEQDELMARNVALSEAEELVIDRLYNVEVVEAQLEQLKVEAAEGAADRNADELLERLKVKELEVETLKANLKEDQGIVMAQKTELNQLKGELIREFQKEPEATHAQDEAFAGSHEAEMLGELKSVKCLEEELNRRESDLTAAENVLLKRLDEITEREAFLEQHEVDAGLRRD
jgi:hypothetical protein